MENSAWRSRTKFIACMNLVLSCISLLEILGVAIASVTFSAVASSDFGVVEGVKRQLELHNKSGDIRFSDADIKNALSQIAWVLWVFVAVSVIIIGIELWATYKLMTATEIERDSNDALERARIWRNVEIVFTVLRIIPMILLCFFSIWFLILLLFTVAWYGGLLFVVCSFIKELESVVTGRFSVGYNRPINVTVKQ